MTIFFNDESSNNSYFLSSGITRVEVRLGVIGLVTVRLSFMILARVRVSVVIRKYANALLSQR